jgi:hypothetical protein
LVSKLSWAHTSEDPLSDNPNIAWLQGFVEGLVDNLKEDYGTMPDGMPIYGGAPPLPEKALGELVESVSARSVAFLRGVPGTYKVLLENGKSYVGKAVDLGKRLVEHVNSGKWKWTDIRAIFTERQASENLRRIREAERLMEETDGLHPAQCDKVLNERMPPKPK